MTFAQQRCPHGLIILAERTSFGSSRATQQKHFAGKVAHDKREWSEGSRGDRLFQILEDVIGQRSHRFRLLRRCLCSPHVKRSEQRRGGLRYRPAGSDACSAAASEASALSACFRLGTTSPAPETTQQSGIAGDAAHIRASKDYLVPVVLALSLSACSSAAFRSATSLSRSSSSNLSDRGIRPCVALHIRAPRSEQPAKRGFHSVWVFFVCFVVLPLKEIPAADGQLIKKVCAPGFHDDDAAAFNLRRLGTGGAGSMSCVVSSQPPIDLGRA
jgi:hypothetical protein